MTKAGAESIRQVPVTALVDLAETCDVRRMTRLGVNLLIPFVEVLPPLDVVALPEDRFGILDGYGRREAHQTAKSESVPVIVHDLEPSQWHRFAVRANVTHGSPLGLYDRRQAALVMLRGGDERSDRAIGEDCGLDHKTVGGLRHWLTLDPEAGAGEIPTSRVGRDGKRYPMLPRPMPPRPPLPSRDDLRPLVDDPSLVQPSLRPEPGDEERWRDWVAWDVVAPLSLLAARCLEMDATRYRLGEELAEQVVTARAIVVETLARLLGEAR